MMKIKMKVKHLVWMMIGVIAIIPLTVFVIHPQISLVIAKSKFERGEVDQKKEIIALLDGYILQSQKWSIIEDYMIEYTLADHFDIIAGPAYSQYSEIETKFTKEEVIPFLEEYVKDGPVNGYLVTATEQLASFYTNDSKHEKADELYEHTISRLSTGDIWIQRELQIAQVKMIMNRSEHDKAEQYLQELEKSQDSNLEDYYFLAEISQLRATNLLKQGNLTDALQEVKTGLKEFKRGQKAELEEFPEPEPLGTPVVFEQLLSLERHVTKALEDEAEVAVRVKGKVLRNDGTPVKNVGVFLREASDVNRSVSDDEVYQAMTSADGSYDFHGVIPGTYQIFLGFMFDQIDGWSWPVATDEWIDVDGSENITYNATLHELISIESPVNQQVITDNNVHFAWEEVEDAAYYNLSVGIEVEAGSIGTGLKNHIQTNKIDIPIDELYAQTAGILFSDTDLEEMDPRAILALTNTENRFHWTVEAYHENGELISQSNGYRLNDKSIGNLPFFYLQERDMTKADRLLLDKKGKEALAAYKTAYEKNPDDIHSLRMITRMIRTEASGDDEEALVLPYFIELANKNRAASDDLFQIAIYYYDNKEWSAFEDWFSQYTRAIGGKENLDTYDKAIYADAQAQQGELKEARKLFKEVMKIDKSNRFVGSWIAVELRLGASFDRVLDIARTFPERPLGKEHQDWLLLVQNVKKESNRFDDYDAEVKNTLDLYYDHEETKFKKWLDKTDMLSFKEFMEAVMEVN